MKISKLIKQLEKMKKKHGDLNVNVLDPDKFVEGELYPAEIAIVEDVEFNKKGKDVVTSLTIADMETAISLD